MTRAHRYTTLAEATANPLPVLRPPHPHKGKLGTSCKAVLAFVADHYREHGGSPTIREIGRAVGLKSSATVHTHLRTLVAHGRLKHDPKRCRSWIPVEAPGPAEWQVELDHLLGQILEVLADPEITFANPLVLRYTTEAQALIQAQMERAA